MPGARLASQQSLWIIRLEVMMLISIACTINSLKRKKNIVTDALYRSICFCPLEKGFSHPDRKWLLWFIHKLSSWYASTSRSVQLSPLSAEQRQHDISVVKASACKSPVPLLVYRKTIASHTQEQMEQNQLQKYLHIFIKHPPFCNFTNSSPKSQVAKTRHNEHHRYTTSMEQSKPTWLFPHCFYKVLKSKI